MNQAVTLRRLLTMPLAAATLYSGMMILLLFAIGGSLTDILGQRADVAASAAMLEQLEGRRPLASGQGPGATAPSASPFLEGTTVTVAGAALLQRVTAAVTKFGGSVQSSQVDLQGTQSKSGFLTVVASYDIDQLGLQQLLYEIETSIPFLFVDQLVVQAPANFSASGGGKLRIVLAVSGQWQGAK
jgi:general secretion pathway protein M